MKLVCGSPCRLDSFLAGELRDHSRTRLAELITSGAVTVDGKPRKPSFRLEPGMSVELASLPQNRPAHDLTPAAIPIDVLFEDEHLLVVSKPRGMATHPAPSLREPSLVNALLARGQSLSETGGAFRPGIVHRLDKATTGLIVVAKTDAAHHALARQFADKTAGRAYLAWVQGEITQPELRIEAPIGRDPKNRTRMAVDPKGKPAATLVRVLKRTGATTLIECRLETGRTHQIRVHLAAIGHPVVGDAVYNRSPGEHPLQLHAARLEFKHPQSGERLTFSIAPPADFIGAESGVS